MRSEAEIQAFIEQLDSRLQKLSKVSIVISISDLDDIEEANHKLGALRAEYKRVETMIDALKWTLSEPIDDDIPF